MRDAVEQRCKRRSARGLGQRTRRGVFEVVAFVDDDMRHLLDEPAERHEHGVVGDHNVRRGNAGECAAIEAHAISVVSGEFTYFIHAQARSQGHELWP